MKIALIGSPGSGKSTFARELYAQTGWPVLALDYYWHQMDYSAAAQEKLLQLQLDFMAQHDDWVIDGNYGHTMAPRMQQADVTLWLQVPRPVAIRRVIGRSLQAKRTGHNRPDMAPNFKEHFDRDYWDFLKFIWQYPQLHDPAIRQLQAQVAPDKTVLLVGQHAKKSLLTELVNDPTAFLAGLKPGVNEMH